MHPLSCSLFLQRICGRNYNNFIQVLSAIWIHNPWWSHANYANHVNVTQLKYAHNMSIIAYITSFLFWRWNYIYVKLWLFQMIKFKSWHFKSSLDFQSVNAQSIDFLKWNSIQYCKWTLSVSNQIQFNMSMNLNISNHISFYDIQSIDQINIPQ